LAGALAASIRGYPAQAVEIISPEKNNFILLVNGKAQKKRHKY
jgi:hypothetical protein